MKDVITVLCTADQAVLLDPFCVCLITFLVCPNEVVTRLVSILFQPWLVHCTMADPKDPECFLARVRVQWGGGGGVGEDWACRVTLGLFLLP